jgi:hypothetical protein
LGLGGGGVLVVVNVLLAVVCALGNKISGRRTFLKLGEHRYYLNLASGLNEHFQRLRVQLAQSILLTKRREMHSRRVSMNVTVSSPLYSLSS